MRRTFWRKPLASWERFYETIRIYLRWEGGSFRQMKARILFAGFVTTLKIWSRKISFWIAVILVALVVGLLVKRYR